MQVRLTLTVTALAIAAPWCHATVLTPRIVAGPEAYDTLTIRLIDTPVTEPRSGSIFVRRTPTDDGMSISVPSPSTLVPMLLALAGRRRRGRVST